jgi:hypothetical protein
MRHLSIKQISDRGQTNVGVRPDVEFPGDWSLQILRPHAIEKDEWTDHAPLAERQNSSDFKAAA